MKGFSRRSHHTVPVLQAIYGPLRDTKRVDTVGFELSLNEDFFLEYLATVLQKLSTKPTPPHFSPQLDLCQPRRRIAHTQRLLPAPPRRIARERRAIVHRGMACHSIGSVDTCLACSTLASDLRLSHGQVQPYFDFLVRV